MTMSPSTFSVFRAPLLKNSLIDLLEGNQLSILWSSLVLNNVISRYFRSDF